MSIAKSVAWTPAAPRRMPAQSRPRYPGCVMVLKALLFDLEDTLWQFPVPLAPERFHRAAAEQLCPLLGRWSVDVDAFELSRRLQMVLQETAREASASLMSVDAAEIADQAARALGLDLEQEQLLALW